jgi:hypothetical protein
MTKVIFDISMSLDGFVTASNVRPEEPMGDGGQRLHEWAFGKDERNRELLAEAVNFIGALIAGRRIYDLSIPVRWACLRGPARRFAHDRLQSRGQQRDGDDRHRARATGSLPEDE